MICMHSGEQKRQNGPENQMISKLCLENRKFFQTACLALKIECVSGGDCLLLGGHLFSHYLASFLSLQYSSLYPCTTKLLGGGGGGGGGGMLVSLRPSVHLSVCPSRICSVAPTVLDRSISYLYILSSNFRRCVVCLVSCKFEFLAILKKN